MKINDVKKILFYVKGWLFVLGITCITACNDSDDGRTLGIGVSAKAGAVAVPGDSIKIADVGHNPPLTGDQ